MSALLRAKTFTSESLFETAAALEKTAKEVTSGQALSLMNHALLCAEFMQARGGELAHVGPFDCRPIPTKGQHVRVQRAHSGYVVDGRVVQGEVHWAGAGGYWCWTDINNVDIPEST